MILETCDFTLPHSFTAITKIQFNCPTNKTTRDTTLEPSQFHITFRHGHKLYKSNEFQFELNNKFMNVTC